MLSTAGLEQAGTYRISPQSNRRYANTFVFRTAANTLVDAWELEALSLGQCRSQRKSLGTAPQSHSGHVPHDLLGSVKSGS